MVNIRNKQIMFFCIGICKQKHVIPQGHIRMYIPSCQKVSKTAGMYTSKIVCTYDDNLNALNDSERQFFMVACQFYSRLVVCKLKKER